MLSCPHCDDVAYLFTVTPNPEEHYAPATVCSPCGREYLEWAREQERERYYNPEAGCGPYYGDTMSGGVVLL